MDHSHHEHHEHHHEHGEHQTGASWGLAASATLHCLIGCAIGEVAGMIIGTALGWSDMQTMALAIGLAFLSGYTLSALPLLKHVSFWGAIKLVFVADTLSIAVMEIVDNAVMALVPGAMGAGLANLIFWVSLALGLCLAFLVAWPLNKYMIGRGLGHAKVHQYHH